MLFDKKDQKVKIETMDKEEMREYLIFLQEEIERHEHEKLMCGLRIKGAEYLGRPARVEFYLSAFRRHQEDIDQSKKLIEEVTRRLK